MVIVHFKNQLENSDHLLIQCPLVREVWFAHTSYWGIPIHGNHKFLDWINSILKVCHCYHIPLEKNFSNSLVHLDI